VLLAEVFEVMLQERMVAVRLTGQRRVVKSHVRHQACPPSRSAIAFIMAG